MNDDTIKRLDAIKELGCEYPAMPMFKSLREEWAIKTEGFRKAEEVIMRLPSADRPQGEWITEYNGNGWNDYWDYICSHCGKKYERADAVLYKANFCPNCGARMKGADDEVLRQL